MKNFLLLFFMFILVSTLNAQQPVKTHPEKGILPFNAPCKSCTEEIEKRTGNTREFFKMNDDGSKTSYIQKSYGNINFKDKDGFWRAKDPRVIREGERLYAARMQPSPVVIDLENKITSITNGDKVLRFNKNIGLVHIAGDGATTSLGEGDWTRVTRTENYSETVFLIQDFYPGIDLQLVTNFGRIETSFILRNRMPYNDGWLVMQQQVEIPPGLQAELSPYEEAGDKKYTGMISIVNESKLPYFKIKKSYAFDAKERMENNIEMPFTWNGSQLDYFVPVNWLQMPSTSYPVTLDPFVETSDTVYQGNISGSGFTTVCGTQGCSYFIDSLMTPPNCEITNIYTYFAYLANLPCIRDDGGFDITMTNPLGASCTTRNFTCLGGIQGACFFWPATLLNAVPPLSPCVLPPQCAPYPLSFELKFRRCNWVPIVPCDASCISANSDWMMTLEGRTAGISGITSASSGTICEGDSINLCASVAGGVPPYAFLWSPGNEVGPCPTFYPTTTTRFTVSVNDACGSVDTASSLVEVIQAQNPGFSITPSDTVCDGTTMAFLGNGNAPASSYDWTIACSGNSFYDDIQALSYISPPINGNCTATLRFEVDSLFHTCHFNSSQDFVVQFCSGIKEQNDPVSSIYPNPTNQELTIVFNGLGGSRNIQLCNVLGECKFNETDFKGEQLTFDLSGLSKGIYFVKAAVGNQMSVHKIILY